MHPKIRHWPSQRYYAGSLEDHEAIQKGSRDLIELKEFEFIHPYAFIDVKGKEEKNDFSYSFINR